MRVAFRCDASAAIGIGHVMRCLSLARELRAHGHSVALVCHEEAGDLVADVADRHDVPVLTLEGVPTLENSAIGSRSQQLADADATMEALDSQVVDWVVVDHYCLGQSWERRMRKIARNLMVIDDLGELSHDCELLLNQNLNANRMDYSSSVPNHCSVLLGPKYALLRRHFAQARSREHSTSDPRTFFAFFGGSDPTGETIKFVQGYLLADTPASLAIVTSSANRAIEDLQSLVAECDACRLYVDIDEIGQLMAECDVAFGAGGSSLLERMCVGLPGFVTTVAANQVAATRRARDLGLVSYLGHFTETTPGSYAAAVETIDMTAMRSMAERAMKHVDGLGCQRVTARMEYLHIDTGAKHGRRGSDRV